MGRKGTPAATRAVVAKRRTDAIEMRHAGVDALTIGRQLKYGTWETDADGNAVQVTADDVLARMVRQDITRGLADRRTGLDTAVATMRQEQTERLERLRAAVWTQAIKPQPNLGAVREVISIERQIAQLWGLATPVKQHVEVGAASAEVEAAVVELVKLVHSTAHPVADGAPLDERMEA